ncbi:hypothetical protein [Streptomyces sp. TLI_171]|uniref:hypothetical protein n=1 Tax=Streptomyces sp. TLI_171 TaxID=1938859 RepID=UPI000C1876FC|nr:hypothetical protein [Streptomyces sp. TLI_171]RKE19627.1 hypothetical protein BX266_2954 [Streptomyces sp. TLI_171]
MPEFTTRTLALIDDIDDKERASDGRSRYGSYLALNARHLHDDGEPLSPAAFAAAAWRIATSPVMAPGYVRIRPDLASFAAQAAEYDPDVLLLRLTVPLRHQALAHRPTGRPADWSTYRSAWTDEQFAARVEPEHFDRTALLLTAELIRPVPDELLFDPSTARPGPRMTHEAKQVVHSLAEYANTHVGPAVASLLAGGAR